MFSSMHGRRKFTVDDIPESGLSSKFIYQYNIDYKNWYQALPYAFSFQPRSTDIEENYIFNLPIAPQNLTITTNYATNVISTLYGIVEEHSEVRFYDIQISGTTGFSPNTKVLNFEKDLNQAAKPLTDFSPSGSTKGGRSSFEPLIDISFGGFASRTANIMNQLINKAVDVADTFLGQSNNSGINLSATGYAAFHNLYRFFLLYKEDAAALGKSGVNGFSTDATRKTHPLTFLNYKDGIKYDCVPVSFTLTRDASNPMLYNYNIKLRAFNLRQIDTPFSQLSSEQLLQQQLSNMGLVNGTEPITSQSLFNKIVSTASDAKAILVGTVSGVSTLGQ